MSSGSRNSNSNRRRRSNVASSSSAGIITQITTTADLRKYVNNYVSRQYGLRRAFVLDETFARDHKLDAVMTIPQLMIVVYDRLYNLIQRHSDTYIEFADVDRYIDDIRKILSLISGTVLNNVILGFIGVIEQTIDAMMLSSFGRRISPADFRNYVLALANVGANTLDIFNLFDILYYSDIDRKRGLDRREYEYCDWRIKYCEFVMTQNISTVWDKNEYPTVEAFKYAQLDNCSRLFGSSTPLIQTHPRLTEIYTQLINRQTQRLAEDVEKTIPTNDSSVVEEEEEQPPVIIPTNDNNAIPENWSYSENGDGSNGVWNGIYDKLPSLRPQSWAKHAYNGVRNFRARSFIKRRIANVNDIYNGVRNFRARSFINRRIANVNDTYTYAKTSTIRLAQMIKAAAANVLSFSPIQLQVSRTRRFYNSLMAHKTLPALAVTFAATAAWLRSKPITVVTQTVADVLPPIDIVSPSEPIPVSVVAAETAREMAAVPNWAAMATILLAAGTAYGGYYALNYGRNSKPPPPMSAPPASAPPPLSASQLFKRNSRRGQSNRRRQQQNVLNDEQPNSRTRPVAVTTQQ